MEILNKIRLVLKKKKESVVFDLYLKDYDHSNFYFALVFNKKIEKFKVLYVPIDAIDKSEVIEEYFCYQFIFISTVNYLLETINDNEKIYKDEKFRNRKSLTTDSYYIEINTHVASKDYKFTFTQFIDDDFIFFFDVIVVLFEHLPNIVSELCNKLLVAFDSSQNPIKYTDSFDFDFSGDLNNLFDLDVINKCKYSYDDILFLENVGNSYYAIINNKLIVLSYLEGKKILNIYSGDYDVLGPEVLIIMKAIKKEFFKDFYRLNVVKNTDDFINNRGEYFLCYGVENGAFKVIGTNDSRQLALELVEKKLVKILNCDESLKNDIYNYLKEKYKSKKINELLNFTISD